MLDRDALNRVSRLNKGGILENNEKKKLRGIIRRAKRNGSLVIAEVERKKGKQLKPLKLESFEGTYNQQRRRRLVYTMRIKGFTIHEMMAELRASSKTIVDDLKQIDDLLKRSLDITKATEILTTTIMDLEALKTIAITELKNAETPNEIAALLNSAAKLQDSQTSLLQDAGMLPKRKLELTGADDTPLIPQTATPLIVHIIRKREGKPAAKFRILDAPSQADAA